MTAHILYSKIDKKNVATFSKKIISQIIRKKIGFKGILISDDISMKALKYDLVTNFGTSEHLINQKSFFENTHMEGEVGNFQEF